MDQALSRVNRRPGWGLDALLTAIATALAIAMILALAFATPPARAAFPGANGPIACGGLRGNDVDLEIIEVNPDGTGERALTNNGFRDGSPAYSPDGSKIAFESQRHNVLGQPANTEIYVANNDGDLEGPDVKRLTFNDGLLANGTLNGTAATDFSPSWSPDGTQIVFHSGRLTTFPDAPLTATDFEIYKMSATNGESLTPATRLTVNRGQDAIPSWSPDGTKIAFQGFPAGNPATLNNNLEIWTMDPDGGNRTNISNFPGTPNDPNTPANENLNGLDRDVIWSPDSQFIAFNSARASAVAGNQNFDVYRATRDGNSVVRLTTNVDSPFPEPFTDADIPLVWSPDGSEILFASSRESTLATTNFFAYAMPAATGDADPAAIRKVTRVEQFQRCDWTSPRPVVQPPPPPPPPVAPPGPPAATADTGKPTGRLLFTRGRIVKRDLLDANGLSVPARIDEPGRVRVDVYVDNGARLPALRGGTSAPRLTLVARGQKTKKAAGRVTLRVKPTIAGRQRIRRARRTRVILVATLRDTAGNTTRLPRRKAVVR